MIPLIHVTSEGVLRELWLPDERQAQILLADPAYRRAGPAPAAPPAAPTAPDTTALPTSEDLVTES